MDYDLYDKPGAEAANKEADAIIDDMMVRWELWQSDNRQLGATDTASREAFAQNVAKRMGLTKIRQ